MHPYAERDSTSDLFTEVLLSEDIFQIDYIIMLFSFVVNWVVKNKDRADSFITEI